MAYTYTDQPDNLVASKLGKSVSAVLAVAHGDSIDRGLSLLGSLEKEGFGVLELATAQKPEGGT